MSVSLYDKALLRLAADSAGFPRLGPAAHASAEHRSRICGSRVVVDVSLRSYTAVDAIGGEVRACALGQAAATILFRHAPGLSPAQLSAAHDALRLWLAGEGDEPDWPGIDALAPARATPARHTAILLPFAAASEAALLAARRDAA